MNKEYAKHYAKTTAKFALQQVPIIGTAVEIPQYIKEMKDGPINTTELLNQSRVKKVRFVVKSVRFMGGSRGYIALNWLETREAERFGIKKNEIFVREDWWHNPAKRVRIEVHERVEVFLRLNFGYDYETAHKMATKAEHDEIKRLGWHLDKAIMKHGGKS